MEILELKIPPLISGGTFSPFRFDLLRKFFRNLLNVRWLNFVDQPFGKYFLLQLPNMIRL